MKLRRFIIAVLLGALPVFLAYHPVQTEHTCNFCWPEKLVSRQSSMGSLLSFGASCSLRCSACDMKVPTSQATNTAI